MKYQIIASIILLILCKSYPSFEYHEDPDDSEELDEVTSDFDCEDNTKWTMNCYICSCRNGKASCSRVPNCKIIPNTEPKICKPFSKFTLDSSNCQSCECNADGIPICTFDYYKCKRLTGYQFYDTHWIPQSVIQIRHLSRPTCPIYTTVIELNIRKCQPHTQWVARCYSCFCKANGQPTCDKKTHCDPPPEAPARCRPGSHPFNIRCVNCFCNDDGNPEANYTKPAVVHHPHQSIYNTDFKNKRILFNLS